MINSIQAALNWMGSRFLVAGFIPSLGFVTLAIFAFDPILPGAVSRRLIGDQLLLTESSLIVLLLSVILGFTLTVLSNFSVKVFEGYILINRLPALRHAQLGHEARLRRRIIFLQRELQSYQEAERMSDDRAQRLLRSLSSLIIQHEITFPRYRKDIMPTRLGNILKAAEMYSLDRFKIDSVTFWPDLVHVIEPGYSLRIAETRNQLAFVINTCLLAIAFGLLSWAAAGYQWVLRILLENNILDPLYFIHVDLPAYVYEQRVIIYAVVGLAALLIAGAFYRASLVSVAEFGNMIRSAYNLFRLDLLKALRYPLPRDSDSERDLWTAISHMVMEGYSWDTIESEALIYDHGGLLPPEPAQAQSAAPAQS